MQDRVILIFEFKYCAWAIHDTGMIDKYSYDS